MTPKEKCFEDGRMGGVDKIISLMLEAFAIMFCILTISYYLLKAT